MKSLAEIRVALVKLELEGYSFQKKGEGQPEKDITERIKFADFISIYYHFFITADIASNKVLEQL